MDIGIQRGNESGGRRRLKGNKDLMTNIIHKGKALKLYSPTTAENAAESIEQTSSLA